MLISEEWRGLNARLHREREDFGSKVRTENIGQLARLMKATGSRTILDYGCGKGALGRTLGRMVRNYDPAVPAYAAEPDPADVVACWDVLEHVEPDCLEAVLGHIQGLAGRAVYFVIATRQDAEKRMADGRAPHLTVEPAEWWMARLKAYWPALSGKFTPGELEARWTCAR